MKKQRRKEKKSNLKFTVSWEVSLKVERDAKERMTCVNSTFKWLKAMYRVT